MLGELFIIIMLAILVPLWVVFAHATYPKCHGVNIVSHCLINLLLSKEEQLLMNWNKTLLMVIMNQFYMSK